MSRTFKSFALITPFVAGLFVGRSSMESLSQPVGAMTASIGALLLLCVAVLVLSNDALWD